MAQCALARHGPCIPGVLSLRIQCHHRFKLTLKIKTFYFYVVVATSHLDCMDLITFHMYYCIPNALTMSDISLAYRTYVFLIDSYAIYCVILRSFTDTLQFVL